jgi:hypothetical protein
MPRLRFALALFAAVRSLTAQAPAAAPPAESDVWGNKDKTPSPIVIPLDFTQKERKGKVPERITPDRRVSVRVDHFNFMFFEPTMTVEAKTVPGYELLEKLWSQVLGLSPAALGTVGAAADIEQRLLGAQSPFLEALEDWRTKIRAGDQQLRTRIGALKRTVALTNDDLAQLKESRDVSARTAKGLDDARVKTEGLILRQYAAVGDAEYAAKRAKEFVAATALLDSLTGVATTADAAAKAAADKFAKTRTAADSVAKVAAEAAAKAVKVRLDDQRVVVERFGATATLTTSPIEEAYYAQALYDAELVHHKALVERLDEFVRRADESAKGRVTNLEKQKSGTIVTVTVRAKPLGSDAADAQAATKDPGFTVSYYVQSASPLVFHAGVAVTNLKSFDFVTVQKSLTGDVFQKIEKPETTPDLTLFMTYLPMSQSETILGGTGFTIGTGAKDLGKRLYLALSQQFTQRLLVTAGTFSQVVTENDGAALSSNPDLFAAIKRVQKWGFFASFSATPF